MTGKEKFLYKEGVCFFCFFYYGKVMYNFWDGWFVFGGIIMYLYVYC